MVAAKPPLERRTGPQGGLGPVKKRQEQLGRGPPEWATGLCGKICPCGWTVRQDAQAESGTTGRDTQSHAAPWTIRNRTIRRKTGRQEERLGTPGKRGQYNEIGAQPVGASYEKSRSLYTNSSVVVSDVLIIPKGHLYG